MVVTVRALRYELRSWETQLRCKPCAVQLGKCSLLLCVQVMASTSEPSVTNSEATAIPSTLVPGTSVVATVLGTSMAGTHGGDGATTTSAIAASTSAVTVADGTY